MREQDGQQAVGQRDHRAQVDLEHAVDLGQAQLGELAADGRRRRCSPAASSPGARRRAGSRARPWRRGRPGRRRRSARAARGARRRTAAATRSSRSACWSTRTRWLPRSASACVSASPMPLPAPVTTAVPPAKAYGLIARPRRRSPASRTSRSPRGPAAQRERRAARGGGPAATTQGWRLPWAGSRSAPRQDVAGAQGEQRAPGAAAGPAGPGSRSPARGAASCAAAG